MREAQQARGCGGVDRAAKRGTTPRAERVRDDEENRLPTEDEVWYTIRAYFKQYGFVRHQLESYNNFVTSLLPNIIKETPDIVVNDPVHKEQHVVSVCNLSLKRPCIYDSNGIVHDLDPHVARLRNLTYSAPVMIDVVHDIFDNSEDRRLMERRVFREVNICHLPVMLGSVCCHTFHKENNTECRLDQGGYFIVNGSEKALVAQEKLHHNSPYIFMVKQPSRYALCCEIRSCNEQKLRSTSSLYVYITNMKKGAVPGMVATLPFLSISIPVLTLYRLLGVKTRKEVVETIMYETDGENYRMLCAILDNDPLVDMSDEELVNHIGKEGTREKSFEKRDRYLQHIINCEFLPHQGLTRTPEVLQSKRIYLGMMVRKLMQAYTEKVPFNDRDHFAVKRVDCAGVQMGLLFRQIFRSVQKSVGIGIYKAGDAGKLRFTNIGEMFEGQKITQAFRYALSTGNWGIMSGGGKTAQNGVSQQLTRMTIPTTISQLRKVATPVAKETKNPKPRQLHPTSWGILCPMDTPEGAGCGLTKSLAMMAHVRVGTYSYAVIEALQALRQDDPSILFPSCERRTLESSSWIPVLVNGIFDYYTPDEARARELLLRLREMRRASTIPFDSSITLMGDILSIDTDSGCILRPLLVVGQLTRLPRIIRETPLENLVDRMLSEGVMEYIDKQEEDMLRVALSPLAEPPEGWGAYTHAEFDASMISGLCGACIPFAELNQSPRNTYQCAMMKQAVGISSCTSSIRLDTIAHTMVCPQMPFVTTRMDTLVGASQVPAGVNTIVAIMCYTGQNQEDSVIVNQAALDRGLFRSVKFQTIRDEEKQNGGTDAEHFEKYKEDEVVGRQSADYSHIDSNGIVRVGTVLAPNSVVISKTVTTTDLGEGARKTVKRDKSILLRNESGVVDTRFCETNRDGTRIAKVKLRKTRAPQVGDKLSSRMGQKGVIGTVLPQEDMPFSDDGLVPDIIVNPHAIPSRMTIGQLCECLLSILCCHTGKRGDGTMFRGTSIDYLCEEMERCGYDREGKRVLHNAFTGEAFASKVFVGPTFYQRLRHMSADKVHARSRGPVHILSRQPTEGRSKDGGLRFGEMERDTLIAHGAAEFLRDRLLDNSDPSVLTLCGKCGMFAFPAAKGTHVRNKKTQCQKCGMGVVTKQMHTPFAFRLLLQELQTMGIVVRMEF